MTSIWILAAGSASGQSSGYLPGKACSIIGTCAGLTAGATTSSVALTPSASPAVPDARPPYEDAMSRLPPDPPASLTSAGGASAFTPLHAGANYEGKSCVYFTRPVVEPGSDQLNVHADGVHVLYGGVHYVCQGRRWKAATGSEDATDAALRAEDLEARGRTGREK